jgi:hypothetical protein
VRLSESAPSYDSKLRATALYAFPVDVRNGPPGDTLELLGKRGSWHRLEICEGEDLGIVDESTDFQSVVRLRNLWVRARDRVNAEAVAPGKQATQPRSESAAQDVLDLGTENDSRRAQHPHAEKHPATHGDT